METQDSSRSGILPFALVALFVVVADQFTKHLAVTRLKPIPGGIPIPPHHWIWLDYTENRGGAFGILQHQIPVFVVTGLVVVALLVFYWERVAALPVWQRIAFGLVLGGTCGNLYDRVHQGFVVDFLDLRWFPVFNVADSAICVGLGLIALALAQSDRPHSTPSSGAMPPAPAEGTAGADESSRYAADLA